MGHNFDRSIQRTQPQGGAIRPPRAIVLASRRVETSKIRIGVVPGKTNQHRAAAQPQRPAGWDMDRALDSLQSDETQVPPEKELHADQGPPALTKAS